MLAFSPILILILVIISIFICTATLIFTIVWPFLYLFMFVFIMIEAEHERCMVCCIFCCCSFIAIPVVPFIFMVWLFYIFLKNLFLGSSQLKRRIEYPEYMEINQSEYDIIYNTLHTILEEHKSDCEHKSSPVYCCLSSQRVVMRF